MLFPVCSWYTQICSLITFLAAWTLCSRCRNQFAHLSVLMLLWPLRNISCQGWKRSNVLRRMRILSVLKFGFGRRVCARRGGISVKLSLSTGIPKAICVGASRNSHIVWLSSSVRLMMVVEKQSSRKFSRLMSWPTRRRRKQIINGDIINQEITNA